MPIPADPGAQVRGAGCKLELFECRVQGTLADANEVRRIRLAMQQRAAGLSR